MRKVIYLSLTAVLLSITNSCFGDGKPNRKKLTQSIDFTIEQQTDSSDTILTNQAAIDETLLILQSRLDEYGLRNKTIIDHIKDKDYDYRLLLPEEVDLDAVKSLITTKGELALWETWTPDIKDIPTSGDTVSNYIGFRTYGEIVAFTKDTAIARRELIEYAKAKQWPSNIVYLWEKNTWDDRGNSFILYLLRSSNPLETSVISNEHIEKASYEDNHGYWTVNISLNSTGSTRFARATKQNVGRQIAIVVDGKVYSAPTVQSEITGGKMQITGNFSEKEVNEFAAIFNCKVPPLTVKIKEKQP